MFYVFLIIECLKNCFATYMQSELLYVMMLNANLKSTSVMLITKILFYSF